MFVDPTQKFCRVGERDDRSKMWAGSYWEYLGIWFIASLTPQETCQEFSEMCRFTVHVRAPFGEATSGDVVLFGGFLKMGGYPHSWMVYSGKSKLDDLGVPLF